MLKKVAGWLFVPVMMALIIFTTGYNSTWDTLIVIILGSLYTLSIIFGLILFAFGFAASIPDNSVVTTDEKTSGEKLANSLTETNLYGPKTLTRMVVYAGLIIGTFVYMEWTGMMIFYLFAQLSFHIGYNVFKWGARRLAESVTIEEVIQTAAHRYQGEKF